MAKRQNLSDASSLSSAELLEQVQKEEVSDETLMVFRDNTITGALFLDGDLGDLLKDLGISNAMDKRKLNILRKKLEDKDVTCRPGGEGAGNKVTRFDVPDSYYLPDADIGQMGDDGTAKRTLFGARAQPITSRTDDECTTKAKFDAPGARIGQVGARGTSEDATFLNTTSVAPTAQQRSSAEDEECYKMDAVPRGLCYIFNNKLFEDNEHAPRFGTERDRDDLERVFKRLKFTVEIFPDCSAAEMKKQVEGLSKTDHSKYDCVILIFLTHGKEGALKGWNNAYLKIDTITSFFKADKCKSLAKKPKLFFFQACRGDLSREAVKVEDDGSKGTMGGTEVTELVAPDDDFFLGYATVSSTKAKRNVEIGSWYIQELVHVFDKYADTMNLCSLMTKVQDRVSKHQEEFEDGRYNKQTPQRVNQLRKALYFGHGVTS